MAESQGWTIKTEYVDRARGMRGDREQFQKTIAGLERARAQGRVGGRPKTEDNLKMVKALHNLRGQGKSIRKIAAELGLSTGTVQKLVKQRAA
jgi:DNA-binding NarL/FixJ family response regulator